MNLDSPCHSPQLVAKLLFTNRNFIFMLAIALALAAGQGATWIAPALVPIIAVTMTLSIVTVTNRDLISIKKSPYPILITLLFNYAIMSGITLFMAKWLILDSVLWAGFAIIVAIPPAISSTTVSYILGGDTVLPLIGTTGVYLIALGLTPVILILLLGASLISPVRIVLTLVQLIVIPLIVSRVFIATSVAQRIIKWRDIAINWCFFIAIYIIIGLNRQLFFAPTDVLSVVFIIAGVTSFGLGHVINFIGKKLGVERSKRISLVVIGTKKNTGLASAVAFAFLGPMAAFPAAVYAMFEILTIVWWGFFFKKRVG
jgi:BASS family bile acid:Na+ symporter